MEITLITRKQRLLSAPAFWLSLVAISSASLLPVEMLPAQTFSVWDKAQHALGFAWLTALGLHAFPGRSAALVAGLLVWGALIEVAQAATGWRQGDWLDWLADGVGVLIVWLAWQCWGAALDSRT